MSNKSNLWHDWFAWYPIKARDNKGDEYLVWLQPTYRRSIHKNGKDIWEYHVD